MNNFKFALKTSLPVMFTYVFLGIAFGIMLNEAGYGYIWSAASSIIIYTGAFQMAMVGFLKAQAALSSILVTAFALGSRHFFYGISFIEDFKKMGKRFPYMMFSLTDETYALYCGTEVPEGLQVDKVRFCIAFLCQSYWVAGSIIGGIIGSVIPFDFAGIDFTMTALFITVLVNQWLETKDHRASITGIAASIVCLLVFGKSNFMLPALIISTLILLVISRKEVAKHE